MLRSKVFLKKTRKGGILKIVREHYLRDDIWCGSTICDGCDHEKTALTENPGLNASICNCQHYLLPDTNVVLHQVRISIDFPPLIRSKMPLSNA